jgi:hypothetical protein
MIRNINSGRGIVVMGGTSSYPYVNMSNASAGMLRYNGNNQNFEVYDGSSWMTISMNHAQIDLDNDTQSLLEWARAKRMEEQYLQTESERNPTIKDLVNQRKVIDDKITMVKTLLKSSGNEAEQQRVHPQTTP